MTSVLVLMSTWNGMKYLPAQLDSLFAQDFDGQLKILVRDDGSSDGTVAYIKERKDPRIRLVQGENLGPRGSFYELLRMALHEDADFFALCDQDDVWRPEKIGRALSLLHREKPAIYASSLDLVDQDLKYLRSFVHPGNRSFVATLISNFVTGCTCVLNRAFLQSMPFPSNGDRTIMHDWWLASVATLGSQIVYDRQSLIGYRQHASNHIGVRMGAIGVYLKLRRAIRETPDVTRFDHVEQFAAAAADRLDPGQRQIVAAFLSGRDSWVRRLRFVLEHRADIRMLSAIRFVLFR